MRVVFTHVDADCREILDPALIVDALLSDTYSFVKVDKITKLFGGSARLKAVQKTKRWTQGRKLGGR